MIELIDSLTYLAGGLAVEEVGDCILLVNHFLLLFVVLFKDTVRELNAFLSVLFCGLLIILAIDVVCDFQPLYLAWFGIAPD